MKKITINYLGFKIDKLTESIEHRASGKSFQTHISPLLLSDLKQITKKNGWLFNWKAELKYLDREVYKLTIQGEPVIHALISISNKDDHIYMHLVENAAFNRGKNKVYLGVLGNIVAFVCKLSFQRGFDGYIAFHSKTKLIDHYKEQLGAYQSGGLLMTIGEAAAKVLVDRYFKD